MIRHRYTPRLLAGAAALLLTTACATGSNPTSAIDMLGAARQGGASAQYLVGVYYETGRNLPVDLQRAAYWYRRGADGDFPHAKYRLAILHTSGRGATLDILEVDKLLDDAARQGHQPAQRDYALFLYRDAPAELRDPVRAYAWLAVVGTYDKDRYRPLAGLRTQIARSMNTLQFDEAERLSGEYVALYPPWNERR